ncbi:hypothetical protein QZH41_001370 [Actinostola sp. cb2023]|nr:hypothetical protein QZH41_001370 [Actinostola sp. cb2023]
MADLRKMFLQIKLARKDQNCHRFVWRESQDEDPKVYCMSRITFGVVSSPFEAIATVQHHATVNKDEFPRAAKEIKENMYVDDLLSGEEDIEKAYVLHKDLYALMKNGGFELVKWYTNSKELLDLIEPELRGSTTLVPLSKEEEPLKALAISWNTKDDTFLFNQGEKLVQAQDEGTKRSLISIASKLFDPLGFLGPFTIRAKILFQELWSKGIQWEESLDEEINTEWLKWKEELKALKELQVPRCFYTELDKIDLDALVLLTDSELEELGISAKGDRLKLKALTSNHEQQKVLKHQKEERLKELKQIIKTGKQRSGQSNSDSASTSSSSNYQEGNATSRKRKGPITVQFGWKHWSQEKEVYVQRRLGGGKTIAVNLFLPDDSTASLEFDKDKLLISLGNFRGEKICSWHNFSLEKYKNDTGMSPPRIYLLTKEIDMDEDDSLEKSAFDIDWKFDWEIEQPHASSSGEQDQPQVKQSRTESKLGGESELLGSSSERKSIKDEQDEAYLQSVLADQAKMKEKANSKEIQDNETCLSKENHDVTAMKESLKAARTKRVPPEPKEGDRARIAIRHPVLGLKTRYFNQQDTMVAVYDWCGSLSLQPAYFSLAPKPELVAQPNEVIQNYDQVILHVRPEETPISIEPSSPTVTLKGFGPLTDISKDDTLDISITSELPDIIMVDDDKERAFIVIK